MSPHFTEPRSSGMEGSRSSCFSVTKAGHQGGEQRSGAGDRFDGGDFQSVRDGAVDD